MPRNRTNHQYLNAPLRTLQKCLKKYHQKNEPLGPSWINNPQKLTCKRQNSNQTLALTDLFEIERQLKYQKEKYVAKMQLINADVQELNSIRKYQAEPKILSPSNLIMQKNFGVIMTEQKKDESSIQDQKPKNRNLQIPLYRAKNQTNQNKLDRISKYIASLKRNMKLNSQSLGYKWKIKQFLLEDPNYIRLKTQLQKFMMRQEELDNILANAVEKGVRQFIEESQIVESNPEYKLIKIYKNKPKLDNQSLLQKIRSENLLPEFNKQNDQFNNKLAQYPSIKDSIDESQESLDLTYRSPKNNNKRRVTQFSPIPFESPFRKIPTKVQIENKAEEDFISIKRELEKSNERYIEMLEKINQSVERGSQKLILLREKRKKKLEKTQDIWGQVQKL